MKYAVIKYTESSNIGDEIQSIAAARLLPKVDYYLDRDYLNQVNTNEEIKLICNGWFMRKSENWPPAENIKPLFIAFHLTITNDTRKNMSKPESIAYFKKHEPIGCRDHSTMRFLHGLGIDAYYSGCLTMTLNPPNLPKTDDIYVVDIFRRLDEKTREKCINQLIPDRMKDKVIYFTKERGEEDTPHDERIKLAEDALQKFGTAKMVITSRIHTALPCLAMGTPVYFVDVGFTGKLRRARFEGILDHMHVIKDSGLSYTGRKQLDSILRTTNLDDLLIKRNNDLINWENPQPNPSNLSKIKSELIKTVQDFIAS